ncbi:MAG: hypothetical protein ACJATT_005824 [Myxococcota bacterium]
MVSDVERLTVALADVERDATKLPWADERPWKASSQVSILEGVPTVDLHGLSIRLGERAAQALLPIVPELDAAALQFITGRGRHTGGISRLKEAVNLHVLAAARDNGWTASPRGPGRILVVADPSKAPSAATGGFPIYFWLFIAFVVFAIAAILYEKVL